MTWINRSLECLWLLTVILVPLAFVKQGDLISAAAIGYLEVPKVAVLRSLVGLMAIVWLLEWGIAARHSVGSPFGLGALRSSATTRLAGLGAWFSAQPTRWLILAVAVYLATTLLSTILSVSFSVSMWGEVPGEDGYATYSIIAYVLLFAVIVTHLRRRAQAMRLLWAVAAMGVLVGVYSLLQAYGFDPLDLRYPSNTTRSTSTMGNAILAGAVLLMTIPVTLVAAAITLREPMKTPGFWWKLLVWALALAAQLLGIIFTDSRGPWFGTILALAGLLNQSQGGNYILQRWQRQGRCKNQCIGSSL